MKKEPKGLYARDSDGRIVRAGHKVYTSYGIPPVRMEAKLVDIGGKLWALTPGHNPAQCTLAELRECCFEFWKL